MTRTALAPTPVAVALPVPHVHTPLVWNHLQFAGYGQQDSQELCNYVLDKLHEDTNRVRKKPYVENFEADGQPDSEIAAEVRRRHKLRNDSHIADLFEGYFKSTVVCPQCQKVSVTFDSFMSVAVPLSANDSRKLTVTLRHFDGSIKQLRLAVPLSGTVQQLLHAAADAVVGVPVANLVCAELYNCKLHKLFTPDCKVEKIHDGDVIFLWEVRPPPSSGGSAVDQGTPSSNPARVAGDDDLLVVVVQHAPKSGYAAASKFMGLPLLLSVQRAISGEDLHRLIASQMQRYTRDDADGTPVVEGEQLTEATSGAAPPLPAAANADAAESESADASSTPWRLHYSSLSIGSFGYEPVGVAVPTTSAPCEFTPPGRGGGSGSSSSSSGIEHRHVIVQWQSSAFAQTGVYDKNKVEADEGDKAGIGCGRKPLSERNGSSDGVELKSCLDLFSREETLDSDNAWYCPRCKVRRHAFIGSTGARVLPRRLMRARHRFVRADPSHSHILARCSQDFREATKKIQFWSLPKVLVLQLKRFSAQGMWRRKNDVHVDFPFAADLAPFVLDKRHAGGYVYDLVAVSNHYGSTGGGHYTAFARNSSSGSWYKFDDSHVTQVEVDQIITPAAYVLIYVQRDAALDPSEASAVASPSP